MKRVWAVIMVLIFLSGCTMTPEKKIEKAEKIAREDPDQALNLLDEVLDEDDENEDAWFAMADIYEDEEDYDDLNDLLEDMFKDLDIFEDEEDVLEEIFEYVEEIEDESPEDLGDWVTEAVEVLRSMDGEKSSGWGFAKEEEPTETKSETKTETKTEAKIETTTEPLEKKDDMDTPVTEVPEVGGTIELFHSEAHNGDYIQQMCDLFEQETGVEVEVTFSEYGDYQAKLATMMATGLMPDIVMIGNGQQFKDYDHMFYDMSMQSWTGRTDFEYVSNSRAVGYPIYLESVGMVYNKTIFQEAGIDPSYMHTMDDYRWTLDTLESQKGYLGIEAPVSFTVSDNMRWVSGLYNFDYYLTSGLGNSDTTVVDDLNKGFVNMSRVRQLAEWVELLVTYSSSDILQFGEYMNTVEQFTTGNSAMIQMGPWIEHMVEGTEYEGQLALLPYPAMDGNEPYLTANCYRYFAISNDSDNMDAAKAFMTFMSESREVERVLVEDMGFIYSMDNGIYESSNGINRSLEEWRAQGRPIVQTMFNRLPESFGMDVIAGIYTDYGFGNINLDGFINEIASAIESIN